MSPEGAFPKVEVPGLDTSGSEVVRELIERDEHIQSEKRGMLIAMLRLGKPVAVGSKGKPKRPTKHVKHMRRMAARSFKQSV